MTTQYSNRDYERRRYWREPDGRGEEREGLWVGVADRERRGRLDDRIRKRNSERAPWPSLDRSDEPRAGDVMTGEVCTIHYSDSVENAARAMVRCDCGALPVVNDNGRLIGMITDRDIVTRVVAYGLDPRRSRVDECMSDRVFACYEEDLIESCLWLMSRHQVRRIPVMDDRDRVVGIVSQADLARHAGAFPGHGERRAFADVMCSISEPTPAPYR
ncbi:MAG TPA: CBS domain-containing protein [Blastocatellia bacterium]|jgi:CBS domain-containing protein|nr:CBS domain-containing protein [Blastocatellia bacterium]